MAERIAHRRHIVKFRMLEIVNPQELPPPSVEDCEETRDRIAPWIDHTPVRRWVPDAGTVHLPQGAEIFLKLELFQRSGSYKARGAIENVLTAPADSLARGVTGVSAGNHAIAVAYAAAVVGTSAKVVMLTSANPGRVERCRRYGAEIELSPDGASAFARADEIARDEGRLFIHPFDSEGTIRGTGTIGMELMAQLPELDAVVVPVGGGGLLAGIVSLISQVAPSCRVFGVEPYGADSMRRSIDAGRPMAIDRIDTIADSLGAPYAEPRTFGLVQRYAEDSVLVTDDELRSAMHAMFADAKLVTEPASASPLAAICGPLRERLAASRIGLVLSGSNIDPGTFCTYIKDAG